MGILNRYIFRQVLAASLMTVGLFVFVLVVGNVMKEVMGDLAAGRVSMEFFIYIIALLIPSVIPYALPLGMLTGILLVFGRMSAQNEVTAIKAAGKSVYSMAAPVFFIAIVASIFSVGINFYYAPVADYTYKSLLRNLIRNDPLQFIQPGNFIRDFPGLVIYAEDSNGKELLGFRIWEVKNGKIVRASRAERATITYNKDTEEILLTMKNASADIMRSEDPENLRKPVPVARFEELPIILPLSKIMGSLEMNKYKLSLMTYGELMAARDTWHRFPPELTTPEQARRDRMKVQTHIQKNFAMAFSIFSMVVLAIPLGIKASRTETLANLAIALALAMGYYMLIVLISWLEKFPSLRPDLLIWLPNLMFQGLGAYLFVRAGKH